jgi:hypothetical protein
MPRRTALLLRCWTCEFLADNIAALDTTGDPVDDLVAVGVPVFRELVVEHPALYRIAFQRVVPGLRAGPEVTAARTRAFAGLLGTVKPLQEADLLGRKSVQQAAVEFNAMLEGLANAELRGTVLPNLPAGNEEEAWRQALTTVIAGFSAGGTAAS